MKLLNKTRAAIRGRSEYDRYARVRQLHAGLADDLAHSETAMPEFEMRVPEVLKALPKEIYKPSDEDPPTVQQAGKDLNDLIVTARRICSEEPSRLKNLLQKVRDITPEHLEGWTVASMIDVYKSQFGGPLSDLATLKEFPKRLKELQTIFQEKVTYWADQETSGHGYKPPAQAPAPRSMDDDEGETVQEFDARLV